MANLTNLRHVVSQAVDAVCQAETAFLSTAKAFSRNPSATNYLVMTQHAESLQRVKSEYDAARQALREAELAHSATVELLSK